MTPAVLIPRFDTEILVEEALRYVKPDSHILDLCTGSGCILLTILAESRHRYGDACEVRGTASDISEDALSVAKCNDERLRTEANFILSDLFNNICGTYDIITTNPPYIPTEIVAGLEPEVLTEKRTVSSSTGRLQMKPGHISGRAVGSSWKSASIRVKQLCSCLIRQGIRM